MEFQLLGPVQAVVDGRPVHVGRRQERFLLAVLLLDAGRPVSVHRLTDLLWHDDTARAPRDALYVYASRLRRSLRDFGVELTRSPAGYAIRVEPDAVDAHRFTSTVARARDCADPGRRAELLDAALGLWRGPALADVGRSEQLCARLEEQRLAALEARAETYLELGRHHDLVAELAELTRTHPTSQRLVAARMLALYRTGRQTAALAAYQEAAGALADELGLDPTPRLVELRTAILRNDPVLAAPVASPPPQAPAQLPGDLITFTGRTAELDALLAPGTATAPTAVVISAIDGMAGIGKTALAVHAAHRLAGRFPDGQLFVDLHGYTQGVRPAAAADVLDRLLRSLGVPSTQIPRTVEERSALWRTSLAGRRMVVVLDNALDEEHVRPLLPGAPGSLVLVTSRHRMTGLDDAEPISLDVLSPADAAELFSQVAGRDRLGDHHEEEVAEVVALCGRLPLAIRIAAARLRHRPTWTVCHLVERLRDQRYRLAELETGERGVTAALDVSYRLLEPDQQRLFRLLGLHPGPDLDTYAVAALIDTTPHRAARLLDDLLDVHLLQQSRPDRYQFHDLVRAHAASTCESLEPEAGRDRALAGLFDHYVHTASHAMDVLYPHETSTRPRMPAPGVPVPVFDDEHAATAWLEAELTNLLAVAQRHRSDHALHLSSVLHRHLRTRGHYATAKSLHTSALQAARHKGDRVGELETLNRLGLTERTRGQHDAAIDCFQRAVELARETGHRVGEHNALWGLGQVHRLQGRYAPALDCFQEALAIARAVDDRAGAHSALTGLGYAYLAQGAHASALDAFQEALAIARAIGDRDGEHITLRGVGSVHHRQRRYDLAIDCFQDALAIARAGGHRAGELNALTYLGTAYRRHGRYEAAVGCYRQVMDLGRKLGHRNSELEAQYGLGQTELATGRPEQALLHHRQALRLAEELDQSPDQARAHDGLAGAYHALGRSEQARRHWQRTLGILNDLGLTEFGEVNAGAIRALLADLDRQAPTTLV